MKARRVSKGLAGAVALLVIYPLAAYADNVTPDGDISVKGPDVALTGSCVLPSAAIDGRVSVKRTGNESSHFAPGDTLTASYSPSSDQISVTGPTSVTVPEWYTENGQSEFFFPIKTTVLDGAPQGSGSVEITLKGAGPYAERGKYNVSWDCGAVRDNVPPVITVPDPITAEAVSASGAPVTFDVTAVDAVDGEVAVTCTPASGSVFPLGTTTVDCTATDKAGNEATGSFTVTVEDTTEPTLTVPGPLTEEAVSASGAPVTFSVTATDAVTANPTVECLADGQPVVSGDTFPLGTTTVTCTATDEAGNTASGTFEVTVQDTTAPEVVVPGAISVEATSAAGAAVTFDVTATDAVTANPTVECLADGQPVVSGDTFSLGTTTVTCTAIDDAGNRSDPGSFSVNVVVGWGGFLQPLNPGGPTAFKMNSTIPVKFRLAGASAGISDLNATLTVRRVDSTTDAAAEAPATSTSAASTGNTFRWDADGALYIYNLSTKALGNPGTYELAVNLGDGERHTIQVVVRK